MPIKSIWRALPVLLASTLWPASVTLAAEDGRPRPAFTGPLDALNPTALPPGIWVIEPYLSWNRGNGSFDDHRRYHHASPASRQWGLALPIQYGITRNLSLHLILSAADRQAPGSPGVRAGDSIVRLLYQLPHPDPQRSLPVISLTLAQAIPSGRYQHLQASAVDGMGSGSRNTVLGINSQTYFWLPRDHVLRLRANLYWTVLAPLTGLRGHTAWNTPADFDGSLRVGRQASLDVAGEYTLKGPWVLVGEVIYSRFMPTRLYRNPPGQDRQRFGGAPGGDSLVLAPAIEYNWNAWIGLIAGVEFTATGRNSSHRVTPQIALNMVF